MSGSMTELSPLVRSATRLVLWRLMPLICIVYVFNFLDRTAIAYAGPNGMNTDLTLSATAFGVASSLYFAGQITCGVPINYWLSRIGAHRAIPAMVLGWGATEALTAFAPNAGWLYFARIMLGVFEAGWAPGILTYLHDWLPARPRGLAYAMFFACTYVASIIGGPLCVSLIEWGTHLHGSLAGWQFMFLLTGVVAVVLGCVVPFVLRRDPQSVRWLTDEQKTALVAHLRHEDELAPETAPQFSRAFRSGRLWLIVLAVIAISFGSYTLTFFLPTIIGQLSRTSTPFQVALLSSVPLICGFVTLIVGGRFLNRGARPHVVGITAIAVGMVGALVAFLAQNPALSIVGLCLIAVSGALPGTAGYSLISNMFVGGAAAAALALLTTLGNLGGVVGPVVTGVIEDATGSATLVFLIMVVLLGCAAFIYLAVGRTAERQAAARAEPTAELDTVDGLSG